MKCVASVNGRHHKLYYYSGLCPNCGWDDFLGDTRKMTSGPKRFKCMGADSWPLVTCYWRDLVPDWGRLVKCFDRGAGLTDIDGFMECNGHFLFIEWKAPGGEITYGQELAYLRLSKQPKTTVYLIEGNPKTLEVVRFRNLGDPDVNWREDATIEEICKRWWRWAEIN